MKANKKNILTLIFSILLGLLILAYVISNAGWHDIIRAFETLSFYEYLFVFGLFFIIYLITLARWGIITNAFGYQVQFSKLLPIRLSDWAIGYITPFSRLGGIPIVAYLFKKECQIEYKKSIAIIILNKVMDFAAALMIALTGILLFLFSYSDYISGEVSFAILFAVLLLSAIIYMFFANIARQEGFFSKITVYFKKILHSSVHKGIVVVEKELHDFFSTNKKKVVIAMCVSLIIDLLTITNYKIMALFLGVNLSFVQLLILFALITVAYFVPTPGSLGSLEGAIALGFYTMGYGVGVGVAFALILRSFELILTGMGLLFVSYFGIKLKGLN